MLIATAIKLKHARLSFFCARARAREVAGKKKEEKKTMTGIYNESVCSHTPEERFSLAALKERLFREEEKEAENFNSDAPAVDIFYAFDTHKEVRDQLIMQEKVSAMRLATIEASVDSGKGGPANLHGRVTKGEALRMFKQQ